MRVNSQPMHFGIRSEDKNLEFPKKTLNGSGEPVLTREVEADSLLHRYATDYRTAKVTRADKPGYVRISFEPKTLIRQTVQVLQNLFPKDEQILLNWRRHPKDDDKLMLEVTTKGWPREAAQTQEVSYQQLMKEAKGYYSGENGPLAGVRKVLGRLRS